MNINPINLNKITYKDIVEKENNESPQDIKNEKVEKIGMQTPGPKRVGDIYHQAPGGNGRDKTDHTQLRHGRDRNVGYLVGKYIQTPPMIFSRDAHPIWLGDVYRGSSCFLIAGGPSFAKVENKDLLSQPGFITMGMNNSVKSYRPNLWCCVDDPTHFMKSIWLDPKITKFVPFAHASKSIFDNEEWKEMDIVVGDCPNVMYYRRNENFDHENFLFEDTMNWGNHSKWGGGRSVFLPSIRLLFFLGIRRVFLLGVDFKMSEKYTYHFDQNRSKGSVKGNNSTYEKLKDRFRLLKPVFEDNGFYIYNCNPDSALEVFPKISFEEAIEMATADMPDINKERTEGLYDRKSKEKKSNTSKKDKIKKELDAKRSELDVAKSRLEKFKDELKRGQHEELKSHEVCNKIEELENKIKECRYIFRQKEKEKNLIWYGTEKAPKK